MQFVASDEQPVTFARNLQYNCFWEAGAIAGCAFNYDLVTGMRVCWFRFDLCARKMSQVILANILRKISRRLSVVQVKLLSATSFLVEFSSISKLSVFITFKKP
jgi:hypothetical protein